MFTHPLRYASASLLAIFCCTAHAANQLDPVTVSASRIEPISQALPVGTLIIDAEDIRRSPAKNTADLLDSLGGLTVRRSFGISGSRSNIDLLGFGISGNSNTLLLLNGRRINNPDSAALNLSNIPLAAIKRIEVLPGSGSALYGYGASGGVINVVTRDSYDTSLALQVDGGDYHTAGGTVSGAAQFGSASAIAHLRKYESDGYRDNNDVEEQGAFIDLRNHTDNLTFYFTALSGDEKLGLPGTRQVTPGVINEFEDDPSGTNTPRNSAEETRLHWMPGMEWRLNDALRFNLDLGQLDKEQDSWFANFNFFSHVEIQSASASPRFAGDLRTGALRHRWTLGFELEEIDADTEFASSPSGPTTGETEARRHEKTWYLHNVINLTDPLALTVGARQSRVDTRYDNGFSDTRSEDELEMYQAGIQYRPQPQFALFANVERSARLANFDEFSFSDGILKPQTGVTESVGASWSQQRQHSVLTFWRGRFDDEIVYDPSAGLFGANVNLDDPTRRQGISLNSRWTLREDLWLTFNGTLQDAEFDGGDNAGNDIPLVAERSAYVALDWQATHWMRWTLAQRYVGDRPFDGDEANSFEPLPSYRWTDLVTTLETDQVWLKVGFYNLTDELVADYGFYQGGGNYSADPLPDRHIMGSFGILF